MLGSPSGPGQAETLAPWVPTRRPLRCPQGQDSAVGGSSEAGPDRTQLGARGEGPQWAQGIQSKDRRGPGSHHGWSADRSALQDGGTGSSSTKTTRGAGATLHTAGQAPVSQVTGPVEAKVTHHPGPQRPGLRTKRPAAPDQSPDTHPEAGSSRRSEDWNEDQGMRKVELAAPTAAPTCWVPLGCKEGAAAAPASDVGQTAGSRCTRT